MLPLGTFGFTVFGFLLVLVGTCQEALSRDLGLDLAQFGLLGAVLALGIGAGVIFAGPVVDRFPRRPVLVGASLVASAALFGVDSSAAFDRLLFHVLAAGFGGGVIDTLLNAVTVERYRERASRPLAFLHGAATFGAVIAPIGIGALDDWIASFRAVGAAFLCLAVWAALHALPRPQPAQAADAAGSIPVAPLVALCIVGFAYVGVENGFTLFAIPYARETLEIEAARGRFAISAFWFGLLAARVVLAVRDLGIGAGGVAWMGALGGLALGGALVTGAHQLEIVAALTGLALGGVFPLMVHLAGREWPAFPGAATGIVVGCGSLGGFVLPWLAGAVGDRAGTAASIACLVAGCALMAAGALGARLTSAASQSVRARSEASRPSA